MLAYNSNTEYHPICKELKSLSDKFYSRLGVDNICVTAAIEHYNKINPTKAITLHDQLSIIFPSDQRLSDITVIKEECKKKVEAYKTLMDLLNYNE